jgi:DNA replication protein DnaC
MKACEQGFRVAFATA